MAPSVTGTSYCLPVRLSVIVSVSGIRRKLARARKRLVVGVGIRVAVSGGKRFAGNVIAALGPTRQILVPTTLAAEWTPRLALRLLAAQHARWSLVHPTYCMPAADGRR